MALCLSVFVCLSQVGVYRNPPNTWFLEPITRVYSASGISTGPVVSVGLRLTAVSNRQTDRPRHNRSSGRHLFTGVHELRPAWLLRVGGRLSGWRGTSRLSETASATGRHWQRHVVRVTAPATGACSSPPAACCTAPHRRHTHSTHAGDDRLIYCPPACSALRPSVRLSVRSSRLLFLSDVHRHIGVLNMKDWSMQPGHLVPHFLAVHLLPCGHSWSSIFRSCILTHPTPSYFSCTLLTDHCGCGVKPSGLICMSTRSTQPCIPPGSLNRVLASAGVKAGRSPLSGGR